MAPKKLRGFTLIELMVVIAIVALLIAMTLPALVDAKARAKSAACQSQLRQLGLALGMYVHDSGAYPAFWEERHDRNLANKYIWPVDLHAYLSGNTRIFFCPADKRASAWPSLSSAELTEQYTLSYRYNRRGAVRQEATVSLGLGEGGEFGRVGEFAVIRPSEMIALYDTNEPGHAWPRLGSGGGNTDDGGISSKQSLNFYVSNRHYGGANSLYCDGHVEYAKKQKWEEPSVEQRRRWNLDHEPHPELWPAE